MRARAAGGGTAAGGAHSLARPATPPGHCAFRSSAFAFAGENGTIASALNDSGAGGTSVATTYASSEPFSSI